MRGMVCFRNTFWGYGSCPVGRRTGKFGLAGGPHRGKAQDLAEEKGLPLILVDGPPGIGCPVISSLTGADGVLIVTEPTLSGLHDINRVLDLASHFHIPGMVLINKYDLNRRDDRPN